MVDKTYYYIIKQENDRDIVKLLFVSRLATLLAGKVQNTSFVPALKSTAESLFELAITVVL